MKRLSWIFYGLFLTSSLTLNANPLGINSTLELKFSNGYHADITFKESRFVSAAFSLDNKKQICEGLMAYANESNGGFDLHKYKVHFAVNGFIIGNLECVSNALSFELSSSDIEKLKAKEKVKMTAVSMKFRGPIEGFASLK